MPPKRPSSPSPSSRKKAKRTSQKTEEADGGKKTDTVQKDGKGEEFWELSGKRRITVSKFGGKQMVGIREYYEKDGEALPSKKGISLTMEQFNTLVTLLPQIETALAEKGEDIVRPDYSGEKAAPVAADSEDEDDGGGGGSGGGKKNFEETSEEDEG